MAFTSIHLPIASLYTLIDYFAVRQVMYDATGVRLHAGRQAEVYSTFVNDFQHMTFFRSILKWVRLRKKSGTLWLVLVVIF